jgi:hypothetical protein
MPFVATESENMIDTVKSTLSDKIEKIYDSTVKLHSVNHIPDFIFKAIFNFNANEIETADEVTLPVIEPVFNAVNPVLVAETAETTNHVIDAPTYDTNVCVKWSKNDKMTNDLDTKKTTYSFAHAVSKCIEENGTNEYFADCLYDKVFKDNTMVSCVVDLAKLKQVSKKYKNLNCNSSQEVKGRECYVHYVIRRLEQTSSPKIRADITKGTNTYFVKL